MTILAETDPQAMLDSVQAGMELWTVAHNY